MAPPRFLVHCLASGVAYTEVCWAAFVKDVALVSHCVPGLGRRTENGERRTENGERRTENREPWAVK